MAGRFTARNARFESELYRMVRRAEDDVATWVRDILTARLEHGFDSEEFADLVKTGVDKKFWNEWVKEHFPEAFSSSATAKRAANHSAQINMIRALLAEGQEDGVKALVESGIITAAQVESAR